MKINPELDGFYFLSMWLNIAFLIGIPFVYRLENLFILVPYVVLLVLNSIYLVIKAVKIKKNNSKFLEWFLKRVSSCLDTIKNKVI